MKNFKYYIILTLAAGQLSGCQTMGTNSTETKKVSQTERLDAAIEKAAIGASRNGSVTGTLIALERKYKRYSDKPEYALAYANGLRRANYLERASLILTPFGTATDAHKGVKTELSTIALGLGNYSSAEKYAQEAVLQDPEDHNAYQNLGIALDAKEMHPEAERAFRKGLEHWQGNPTVIMNNLALNLASQGFIDEAVEILERAKALSPDRIEIERNLRIIRTLNER